MILQGKVISVDTRSNSGVIRGPRGSEYFFYGSECQGEQLPELNSTVEFYQDPDFKSTKVACAISLKYGPSRI